MSATPEIRWCLPAETSTVMRFIDEHWRNGHVLSRDEALFRWQYRHLSDPSRLSVLGGWRGDRLVGMLGVVQADSCVSGKVVPGAWLTLWYADPAEAGLGLQLLKAVFTEGFGLLATSGMNSTSFRLLRAMRFAMMDEVPRWVLPVNRDALATLTGTAPPPASSFPEPPGASPGVVNWTDSMAPRWDEAWQRMAPEMGTTGVWRDAAYIGWRYSNHPRFQYRIRVAVDRASDGLTGLAVTRVEQVRDNAATVLRILELLGDDDARHALTHDIVHHAHAEQVAFADFYCTRTETGSTLEEYGFIRDTAADSHYPSLFQPLDPRPRPLNLAVWTPGQLPLDAAVYFTRSDGDQDRPN